MKTSTTNIMKTLAMLGAVVSSTSFATEDKLPADMSDPLAVYNQVGAGVTDRGLNLKFGQTYDTGSDTTMGMNVIEVKGIFGEALGWSNTVEPDNSIDSFRFRNFNVDMENGRGAQLDANYTVETEALDVSYSIIQALPKMGSINLYPLAGLGVTIQNNAIDSIDNGQTEIDSGFSMPGAFGVVGMYGKWAITDQIWFNYNPMWLTSLAGSDYYKDNTYGAGNSNIFLHEVILSYQINPVTNVRYFANFSDEVNFADGEHRIEFNYQF